MTETRKQPRQRIKRLRLGLSRNDGTGDTIRTAMMKIDENIHELRDRVRELSERLRRR